jgi:hypothetical protein
MRSAQPVPVLFDELLQPGFVYRRLPGIQCIHELRVHIGTHHGKALAGEYSRQRSTQLAESDNRDIHRRVDPRAQATQLRTASEEYRSNLSRERLRASGEVVCEQ